jgi:hypothetical protein
MRTVKVSLRLLLAVLAFHFITSCQSQNNLPDKHESGDAPSPTTLDKNAVQHQVEILIDDAILKKPFAIIAGTVRNISDHTLSDLKIELELKRRADDSRTTMEAKVSPANLLPGTEGRYTLRVLSDEWRGSKLVSIRTGASLEDLPFTTKPGASRPPERAKPTIHLVKIPRSKPDKNNEEFINTPDTAVEVP